MRRRIIIFTTSYHPFIGGAEIAIQEITKRLREELDFFIVTARLRSDLPKKEVRPEGTIIRVGFGSRLDKYLLILSPFHYRGLASIVVGVDISQGAVAAAIYKLLHPRIPFIFNIQFGYGEERLRRGRLGLIALMFRFILSQADYVTAISSYLLNLARRYGYGGSAEVIPNGVDTFLYKTNRTYKSDKTYRIITTSRLVPKNGVDILIKAIAEVKKTLPEIQCWIIGDGPEKISYQLLITSYRLEDNLKLLGEIPYEKIPEYLHQADIFVRPSRSEGMGNSFVEALAAGLPMIGTPVGGITDIIKDGKTGLFCRPDDPSDLADKIVKLFEDVELSRTIAENGRKMVEERFSWDFISSAYVRVLKKVRVSPRLLIATPLFPPDIGGPATYSRIISEELPRRNIEVEIVNFGEVKHLPKIIRHAAYFWRVLKASRRADAVFAQDPVSVGLPAWLAVFISRKPFLLKIVGDYAWEQYQQRQETRDKGQGNFITLEEFQKKRFDFITELRRSVEHFVAKRAEKIIVPSDYLKGIVSQWGVLPEKITVIYNAFEYSELTPPKAEARSTLGLSGIVLVSAGRLVPWKGFDTLIEVIPQITREFPEAKLFIIGDGPERENYELGIRNYGLENNVKLLGSIYHKELLRYLSAADIFVLNTGYEGLSHVILEAMASGVPIITTTIGGNPELIENNVSGILVGYNDKEALAKAVFSLLKDESLRRQFSEKAKNRLKQFSKERMIDGTVQCLIPNF